MQKKKPDYYNDLEKTYIKTWDLLEYGLLKRDSPFHIPVFICGKNNLFDGRVIVLRDLDKNNKSLSFHTDIRSNKIKSLKVNPLGTFLFYDKVEKIQLRIICNTKIHHQNDKTIKSWKKTVHMSRQCYLGIEESEVGYKNFSVVECLCYR